MIWNALLRREHEKNCIHIRLVSADLLSPAGSMAAKVDLNVRKAPGASSEVVCTVEKGYPFKYISKKGAWIQVQDDPAKKAEGVCKGWVYAKNLWGFFKQ